MRTIFQLFLGFLRASNLSFGGGPAQLPLIQEEVVKKYRWVTDEEFADLLAIANSLPAPLATKLAGSIGYRVKGWPGALAAMLGAFLPTSLVVILLGSIIINYADSPVLQSMLKGVRPVVAVLLAQVTIQLGRKAFSDKIAWFFGITALAIMLFIPGIHPAFLVIASMLSGYFIFRNK
jgi:chromate transporter